MESSMHRIPNGSRRPSDGLQPRITAINEASTSGSVPRVLMIATVGEDVDPVLIGVRDYPVRKLVLLTIPVYRDQADGLRRKLEPLHIEVLVREVDGHNVLMDTLQKVGEIYTEEVLAFDEVVLNVSSGDKMQTCSALSAAFVNGIPAIGVGDGVPFSLPVLKFSYHEMISEAKFRILETLDRVGGSSGSLAELSEAGGIEKSLLSYHLRTTREGKGLEEMGLVHIDRGTFGRLQISLTEMGRLLLIGRRHAVPATTSE